MIIWGFGKTIKKVIGAIMRRQCQYCNRDSIWELCIVRTWFTLFFIPVIPYKSKYCVVCPNCDSYIELDKDKFLELKAHLESN